MGPDVVILAFWYWVSSQLLHSPLSCSWKGSLVPLCFLPLEWYYLHIWGCWYFSQQSLFQPVIQPDILHYVASLIAQSVKNLPAMQETQVWFLGWEDSLEKEMATHSSILAWRTPWIEDPGRLQSMGSQVSDMISWLNQNQHYHSAYKLTKQGEDIQP